MGRIAKFYFRNEILRRHHIGPAKGASAKEIARCGSEIQDCLDADKVAEEQLPADFADSSLVSKRARKADDELDSSSAESDGESDSD